MIIVVVKSGYVWSDSPFALLIGSLRCSIAECNAVHAHLL